MRLFVFVILLPFIAFAEGPLSPSAALASYQTHPEFSIELIAAEPLVMDPVAFDWDPAGRLWVIEMRDYPIGLTWNKPDDPQDVPGGRVKILTDTDSDGIYDKASIFLDNLPYPTGIKVWKDGALITAAPDIIFARDTNGDSVADEREVWYSGFAKSNQQHRVNGLAWGLDNWLHVANGDGGGMIESTKTREEVDIRGHDLRIHPVTREQRLLSGRTQCGRFRDDWGNWFGCNNSNPLWHYPLREDHIRRNPLVKAPRPNVDVPEIPGASPVYPVSKTPERFNQAAMANRFTSACGPTIYRDVALGKEYEGNAFICEPVHNLISRQVLLPKGAAFTSRRAEKEQHSEFLASSDNWARPVSVRTGPDGALWFADMYRAVIEHPEWIPHDQQLTLDIRAGHQMGRIYRLKRTNSGGSLEMEDPLKELNSPNGTRRDMAHQMLLWDPDESQRPELNDLVKNGKTPQARLHALSVLSGQGALSSDILSVALQDSDPRVARNAIRLSGERREVPEISAQDAFVALELAGSESSGVELAKLLTLHGDEVYVAATALSSVQPENIGQVLNALEFQETNPGVLESLSKMAARWKDETSVGILVNALKKDIDSLQPWKVSVMLGGSENPSIREQTAEYLPVIKQRIADRSVALTDRLDAVRLYPRVETNPDRLIEMITPLEPRLVQDAVFDALRSQGHPETAARLIARWNNLTPDNRKKCLSLLMARGPWVESLMTGLENGVIPAFQIETATRRRLIDSSNADIKSRSENLFKSVKSSARANVVSSHSGVLTLPGDRAAGKDVFSTACITCHVSEGKGNPIGPDLAALTDLSPDSILVAILDPNRAVEDKFIAYQVITKSEEQLYAMIESEDSNTMTLRGADGKPHKVSRTEVAKIEAGGLSLMPEGFESALSDQQLADVIAYVRSLGGAINPQPVLSARIRPRANGTIELSGDKCRLTGREIKYDDSIDSITSWLSEEDRAEWTVVLDRPGKYVVEWEWAAGKVEGKNRWQLLVNGSKTLSGEIGDSGGPKTFKTREIGRVNLTGGDNKIVIKANGEMNSSLMTLRRVRFNSHKTH